MKEMTIQSYAKINLFLDIKELRQDGYHQLEMINAKISLHDKIVCTLIDQPDIQIDLNDPSIPNDKSNTAYQAAARFFEKTDQQQFGINIKIEKNIPHGAGLGGGSSNAGYVLQALNQLFQQPLTQTDLLDIGKSIGADVPFFLIPGCARVGGIGEILNPIKINSPVDEPPIWVVLCSPRLHVSTKTAFRLWDQSNENKHADADKLEAALHEGNWQDIHKYLFNSFEPVIYAEYPEVYQAFQNFYTISPTPPLLSGSGSNLFSVHTEKDVADDVCEHLLRKGYSAQVCSMVFE